VAAYISPNTTLTQKDKHMPWNKDDEGGGQGPWGQGGGNGPRKPGNQNNWGGGNRGPGSNLPPDLDELIRRGKDSLKGALPGGGAGRSGWLLPIALAAAFVVFNSVYQVQPDERGVVMRLGQYNRTADPGLHFALWPVERMEKPKVGSVRQINIGMENNEATMLTSDKNIISVPFSVFWQISDAKSFLYNIADPEELIRNVSQSAMREVVGQTKAQPLLTNGKDLVAADVMQITQGLLDSYQAGVTVTAINLGDVQPPAEVANAFAEVVRAGQDQQRLINEADQYKNQQLRLAEGEAAKLTEDASAYKASVVADAQGEAARFVSVYDQYKNAKDVTRQRMFLETMEEVLGRTNKIIVESGKSGPGIVPYLPLPALQNRSTTQQQN
jgi:modulator of FtsH protease HflK